MTLGPTCIWVFFSLRSYHLHKPLLKIMLINSHGVIQQTEKKKKRLQKYLQICMVGRDMPEGLCQCVFKAAEWYYQ